MEAGDTNKAVHSKRQGRMMDAFDGEGRMDGSGGRGGGRRTKRLSSTSTSLRRLPQPARSYASAVEPDNKMQK